MNHQEGVELLALGMFFGPTSDPNFHKYQERLKLLSDETIEYEGHAEVIEQDVVEREYHKPVMPSEGNWK